MGVDRAQFLERVAGKEGLTFFKGVFSVKSKLRSDIFNYTRDYKRRILDKK